MKGIRDKINDILDGLANVLGLQPQKIPVPVKNRNSRKKK